MMQEHPFFSSPQIFYGKPIEEDEEESVEIPWPVSLGEMQKNPHEKIGLFFFWCELSESDEAHFS